MNAPHHRKLIRDESDFHCRWGDVADKIYEHLETVPRGVLGFDEASVDWPRSVAVKFSCVAADGLHRREVTVIAHRQGEEPWKLTHTEAEVFRRPPPPKGTEYFLK